MSLDANDFKYLDGKFDSLNLRISAEVENLGKRIGNHRSELQADINTERDARHEIAEAFGAHAAAPVPGAHPFAGCPAVDTHEDRHHDPVRHWGIISGVVGLVAALVEIVRYVWRHPP